MPPSASTPGDNKAIGRFVEKFAMTMADAGFPRMAARVFVGLLIAEPGGRTASELAELLKVSPAAISGAVRYLMQIGMASRERVAGSRSDRYMISNDMWYETLTRRDAVLMRWEDGLLEGVEAVGSGTPAGDRLEETRQFFEFIRGEFPLLMDKWRDRRAASKG